MENFNSVAVIGLGYIGLPTAAMMASCGLQVVGVDINPLIVEKINRGEIHIVENNIEALVKQVVMSGKLRATTVPEQTQVFLIAVPTPFKENHEPDVSYVQSAVFSITPHLQKGNLVILESTSPVGTTELISGQMAKARKDLSFPQQAGENADIQVAYCPERVMPGHIIRELKENDRVIGGLTPRCARRARDFYKIFVDGECIITNARTAEMSKLTENAFRDVNIAFANELSLICEKMGIDVWELISLANHHPRVNILQPGPGVGGHCIAVDPWFIVHSTPEQARLIRTAREINDARPSHIVARIKEKIGEIAHPIIACLGLAYKPDINDLRESPAIKVVEELIEQKLGHVLVVEPHVTALPSELVGKPVELVGLDIALQTANVVVLLVHHKLFMAIDREILDRKIVVDTRGVWR